MEIPVLPDAKLLPILMADMLLTEVEHSPVKMPLKLTVLQLT